MAKKTGKLTTSSVPKKRPDLLVRREVDNSVVVLNLESNRIFQIDGVATDAWEMIDGKKKISAIASAIAKANDWTAKDAEKLVLSFCQDLQKQDLVEL